MAGESQGLPRPCPDPLAASPLCTFVHGHFPSAQILMVIQTLTPLTSSPKPELTVSNISMPTKSCDMLKLSDDKLNFFWKSLHTRQQTSLQPLFPRQTQSAQRVSSLPEIPQWVRSRSGTWNQSCQVLLHCHNNPLTLLHLPSLSNLVRSPKWNTSATLTS